MSLTQKFPRRHDLDWLRAIAFGLLIFYHIGMAYVPWGWHVKSAYGSEAWVLSMALLSPWRLALLFFISGVGVRFASDAMGAAPFTASRSLRLGLPIVFGMAALVMPQSYFELLRLGEIEPGILAFWPRYLSFEQAFTIVTPTWNHLWYIVYLLLYILIIAPFLPWLRRASDSEAFARLAERPLVLILGFALPFAVYEYTLSPRFADTNALIGDWANHAHRFTVFLLGYAAAKSEGFWRGVRRALPRAIALAVALGSWRVLLIVAEEDDVTPAVLRLVQATAPAANVLYAWSVILSLLGLAQRFLNRPSRALGYLTGAVFCYYVVHQTIIVAFVALLGRAELGGAMELTLVTAGTVAGTALSYELLRRIPVLRIAFGIKQR